MVSSCGEAAVSGVSLVDSINILLIQIFAAMATGRRDCVSQVSRPSEPRKGEFLRQTMFFYCGGSLVLLSCYFVWR